MGMKKWYIQPKELIETSNTGTIPLFSLEIQAMEATVAVLEQVDSFMEMPCSQVQVERKRQASRVLPGCAVGAFWHISI